MKKKKILISIFSVLILITAIIFITSAKASYDYDMNPQNGVDILEGFGAVLTLVVGGYVVFCEFDLFITVYYFLVKPRIKLKSILNILCNLSLLLSLVFLLSLPDTPAVILILTYVILRIFYIIVSVCSAKKR